MNQEILLKLVLPPFTHELLSVVKVLITSPIHEAGVIGLNFRLWVVFFSFNWMVEGDILVSAPFSGEERALKLTQMHPENEKNKEHKDYSLKNNFFFLSFLFFSFFFWKPELCFCPDGCF